MNGNTKRYGILRILLMILFASALAPVSHAHDEKKVYIYINDKGVKFITARRANKPGFRLQKVVDVNVPIPAESSQDKIEASAPSNGEGWTILKPRE